MSGTRSTVGRATLRATRGTALTVAAVVCGAMVVVALQTPQAIVRPKVEESAPVHALDQKSITGPFVKLDRDGQEKGGVETAVPKATTYRDQVRAYGTVMALDRLTTLYNQSIAASAQLQAAQVKFAASKIANERAKNLLKVFSTAQAQAEAAEATFRMDQAAVSTAEAQLEILRNSAVQDWGPVLGSAIVTRAPLAERLVRRNTVLVQVSLQPGTFTAPPRRIALSLVGRPNVEAEFVSEATQVDPRIQNIGFWYVTPVSTGLVAGTSVLAYLPKGETRPGVDIPPSAIVWQAGKAWMFVRQGSDHFERHAIDEEAEPTSEGGYVVPAASLAGDKRVVVAGAQILLSEELKSQMPAEEDDN